LLLIFSPTDTQEELAALVAVCKKLKVEAALSDVWARGGEGGIELAQKLLTIVEDGQADFAPLYPDDLPLAEKAQVVAREIYGANDVIFTAEAAKTIKELEEMGYGKFPICMAKTQYSFSDDPSLLGRPTDFTITVRQVKLSAGAGFIVMLTGNIMTMPGLPKVPAAERIDVDKDGRISGLF
jgi:formate--tetrahydrofolate ligase